MKTILGGMSGQGQIMEIVSFGSSLDCRASLYILPERLSHRPSGGLP
jgi:hypothetical protein